MGTLTVKSPQALNFLASSPVKERKLELLPDGEISLQITYEDNTELSLHTAKGSIHVSSNKTLLIDNTPEKADLSVAKK